MNISLTNVSKRFNREWIFRGVTKLFEDGKRYAITGSNGSGKSTLLQVIGGAVMLSEGKVAYSEGDKPVATENAYRYTTIAAPYLELVEEMSAMEFLSFHAKFKPLSLSIKEILSIISLEKAAHKQIRYYSSGMKQRLKLGQAIFSDTPVLLLDEPCTNLDEEGIRLYQQLIANHCQGKLIIVSSNDKQEYGFCTEEVKIGDYK